MKVYFDYTNVQHFIQQRKEALYDDCLRALRRQLDVQFNFKKSALKQDEEMMTWFTGFASSVGNTELIFSDTKFPDRPLKSNAYLSMDNEQLGSIYLLDDVKIDNLKESFTIIAGAPGEEVQTISRIFLHNEDYKFDKKLKIAGAEFSNWEDLGKYPFESTDILIVDQFILSDKEGVTNNLLPLLSILSNKSKSKLNLVIYTKHIEGYQTYDDVKSDIRKAVSGVTGKRINLTIVQYRDQRDVKVIQAEHDRTIFTNYSRYYSGDTFNYWHPDGTKRTKGRELHIAGYGNKENHTLALELISEIQEYIDSLPDEMIEGDKKSNFLSFKESPAQ